MKNTLLLLLITLGVTHVKAGGGDRPSKDTNQKVFKLETPSSEAIFTYNGGDTLFLSLESNDLEPTRLKLLGGATTLLVDQLKKKPTNSRVYILSALPAGDYKIQLKKGNYVVEKNIIKYTGSVSID